MEVAYLTRFRSTPKIVVNSPGRINLIGEHTDYNDGFVFPAAINLGMNISVGLAQGANRGFDEVIAADRNQWTRIESQRGVMPKQSWLRYIWGMLDGLGLLGVDRRGFLLSFGGNIPGGAGLSSSAALCVGLGLALNELYDLGYDRATIAKMAQRSEREFAGVNCGLMDQYASLFGKAGHFMKLDCRNNSFEYVPAELGEYALLLVDSRVKHGLASTSYNKRRQECQQGLSYIQKQFPRIRSLRDADKRILLATQKLMPETIFKKLRYVTEENERVQQVAQALAKGDLEQVGACMFATHEGLKHDYEVSCAEVDLLVDIAKSMPYVLGARIMGGGFGGCTINLLKKSEIPAFTKLVAAQYQMSRGKEAKFYEVKITDGGHFLKH